MIISDTAKTPVFFRSGDIRVIPVECAYAVIEIKTFLNSKELDNAFENMKSVKNLEKKAYFKPIILETSLYGKKWEIWPINYYIFAYDSIKLQKLAELIFKKNRDENLTIHSRIDTICVLDKGVICNHRKDGEENVLDALPQQESNFYISKPDKSLLLFYALTSKYFNQANIPNFRFSNYLGKIKF